MSLQIKKLNQTLLAAWLAFFVIGIAIKPSLAETTIQDICGDCKVEEWVKGGALIEAPAVDKEGNVWIVSMDSGWIHKITPDGTFIDVINTGGVPNGLAFHQDGRLFCADRRKGIIAYDPKTNKFSDYVNTFQGENFHGVNDLVFDTHGGMYFTDPWGTSPANPLGCVYYVSPDKKISRLISNMAYPNGIGLSPDEKVLYVDNCMANNVWLIPLEEPGVINVSFTRVMTYLGGGAPDGMCLDENGNLYVADLWMARVDVIGPTGRIIGYINLPEGSKNGVTNCAFGGPNNKTLYITEAYGNVTYKVEMNVKGLRLFGDRD